MKQETALVPEEKEEFYREESVYLQRCRTKDGKGGRVPALGYKGECLNQREMIIGSLQQCERIEKSYPYFKEVFDYIKMHDLSGEKPGRIEWMGKDLYINVEEVEGREEAEADLEIHREYIDIQMPLVGKERLGWKALNDLGKEGTEYNRERDIAFYREKGDIYFTLLPGQFVIFFPEDAHAPCLGKEIRKKLVVKIKIKGL